MQVLPKNIHKSINEYSVVVVMVFVVNCYYRNKRFLTKRIRAPARHYTPLRPGAAAPVLELRTSIRFAEFKQSLNSICDVIQDSSSANAPKREVLCFGIMRLC